MSYLKKKLIFFSSFSTIYLSLLSKDHIPLPGQLLICTYNCFEHGLMTLTLYEKTKFLTDSK